MSLLGIWDIFERIFIEIGSGSVIEHKTDRQTNRHLLTFIIVRIRIIIHDYNEYKML